MQKIRIPRKPKIVACLAEMKQVIRPALFAEIFSDRRSVTYARGKLCSSSSITVIYLNFNVFNTFSIFLMQMTFNILTVKNCIVTHMNSII